MAAEQVPEARAHRRRRSVGRRVRRMDGPAKVRGSARFLTDLDRPGLLDAAVLRSPVPHGDIASVSLDEAVSMPGVVSAVTREDLLGSFDGRVRHYGDVVAAVAAETPERAEAAISAIEYELEPRESTHDPRESVTADAPVVQPPDPDYGQPRRHPRSVENPGYERNVDDYHRLEFGDVEAGLDDADHVFTAEYRTPRVNHCNLETHGCIAEWNRDTLVLTETIGNTGNTERTLERLFGDRYEVRVQAPPTAGSSFGGRSLATLTLEPVAATLSRETGRPVRLRFDREDEFTAGDSRHELFIQLSAGTTDAGRLTALDVDVVADTGPYPNGVGHIVLVNCQHRPLDLYRLENYRFEGVSAFTNNSPAGEYRGIGVTQITWALESHLDELVREAGLDPIAFRRHNWVESGYERPPTGRPVTSCGLLDCLARGREAFEARRQTDGGDGWRYGWGVASGTQSSTPASSKNVDYTEAELVLETDGALNVHVGAIDLGQGAETVLAQIVAEKTGVPIERVTVEGLGPGDGLEDKYGSIANRTTYLMGTAIERAARELVDRLRTHAADRLEAPADTLTLDASKVVTADGRSIAVTQLLEAPLSATGRAETDVAPASYGVHFAEVAVDEGTGTVDVRTYVAAQDVGYAINPALVEGQLEGAVQHGIEFALLSSFRLDDGLPTNASLDEYPVSSPVEMPDRLHCELVESREESGPFGAKGVGTPSIVPVAPAITNAIRDAIGVRFTTTPVRPADVYFALHDEGVDS